MYTIIIRDSEVIMFSSGDVTKSKVWQNSEICHKSVSFYFTTWKQIS